jgi:hypothetical protein
VILDLTDDGLRTWWAGHAMTTDTVSGLLVLLITVLVVDQVVRLRQIKDRARAVAAQAAIMVSQATRSSQAVSQALAGSGDRDAAGDELRTYMMMLLVGAPVLIGAKASRNFLEQAQSLGAEMARALVAARTPGRPATRPDGSTRRCGVSPSRPRRCSRSSTPRRNGPSRATDSSPDPAGRPRISGESATAEGPADYAGIRPLRQVCPRVGAGRQRQPRRG